MLFKASTLGVYMRASVNRNPVFDGVDSVRLFSFGALIFRQSRALPWKARRASAARVEDERSEKLVLRLQGVTTGASNSLESESSRSEEIQTTLNPRPPRPPPPSAIHRTSKPGLHPSHFSPIFSTAALRDVCTYIFSATKTSRSLVRKLWERADAAWLFSTSSASRISSEMLVLRPTFFRLKVFLFFFVVSLLYCALCKEGKRRLAFHVTLEASVYPFFCRADRGFWRVESYLLQIESEDVQFTSVLILKLMEFLLISADGRKLDTA